MNPAPSLLAASILIATAPGNERVLTHGRQGHLIHNRQVFSPDGRFIVFDSRNDETAMARSTLIGRVEVATGREEVLYQTSGGSEHGPGVGAATFNPVTGQLCFLHGLSNASALEPYAPHRRFGASLDASGRLFHLDARDVTPPFTSGASRGGTHAHHWSPDGTRLSFTYNDAVSSTEPAPRDLRTVGVMLPGRPVVVAGPSSAGEFPGSALTMLVVKVTAEPRAGSDDIMRAFDEGWLDRRRIAFQGMVRTRRDQYLTEIFLAELPDGEWSSAAGSAGTASEMPAPPAGIEVRRFTHSEDRKHPGIQGPRHWVRPSPDGSMIAFLAKDDHGTVQVFTVSPRGGEMRQLTRLRESVDSPIDWSPDSRWIACSAGTRVCMIDASDGQARFLTPPSRTGQEPRHGVVFSPDGRMLAFNRKLPHPGGGDFLQICLLDIRVE